MVEENFDVLFTFDRNLQFQQNFKKYPISVIVIHAQDNAYLTLKGLVPKIRIVLKSKMSVGPIVVKASK